MYSSLKFYRKSFFMHLYVKLKKHLSLLTYAIVFYNTNNNNNNSNCNSNNNKNIKKHRCYKV